MDNKSKRGKADRIRIAVNQEHELRYWTKSFGITRATLRLAVKTVGPMVGDVKDILITWIRTVK